MASAEIININKLLAPISEASPCGIDLREDPAFDSSYRQIKDARQSARAVERDQMFDQDYGYDSSINDWKNVYSLASNILATQSKDLEVCGWFIESVVRVYGFAGLRDCFKLSSQLIEKYWDIIYPLPDDEDGLLTRVIPFAGLNGDAAEGVLISAIRTVPITQGQDSHSMAPFNYWHYTQTVGLQKITDPDKQKLSYIEFSEDDIKKAVDSSSKEFYLNLCDDIYECKIEFMKIHKLFVNYCGISNAPRTSHIITVLEQVLAGVYYLTPEYKSPVKTKVVVSDL